MRTKLMRLQQRGKTAGRSILLLLGSEMALYLPVEISGQICGRGITP